MTNEQVIINNIDVSECEYLTETRHCKAQMAVMGTDANKCKCFPNCYYKQLKRKEKECEELKKTLIEIKEIAKTGLEGFCPKCSRKECEDNNCIETAIRDILQKISKCEVENAKN